MTSHLVKFEEDIIAAFQESYGKVEKCNNDLLIHLNKQLTPLLIDILNSYYFENDFKASYHSKKTYNGEFNQIIYHENYEAIPFIRLEYSEYYSNQEPIHYPPINTEIIKQNLKEIDPFYNLIFETDALKQKLNIIKKHDIEYTIVTANEKDIFDKFSKLHKIGNYKKNWNQDFANYEYIGSLEDNLKYLNQIEFVKFDHSTTRNYIVAHNHNQIVGISSMCNYTMLNNIYEEKVYYASKHITYNSYIAVASQFRGHGIALELLNKSIDYAKEKNMIMVRSSPTLQGKKYLYDNANELVKKRKDVCIINHCDEANFLRFKNNFKNINSVSEFNTFLKEFIPIIQKISAITQNYESMKKDVKDYLLEIDIMNEYDSIIDSHVKKDQQDLTKIQIKTRKHKYRV